MACISSRIARVFSSQACELVFVCFKLRAREQHQIVLLADISEESLQPVVVLVQNRIELVVVTSAQPYVMPMNTAPTVSVMSFNVSCRRSSITGWLVSSVNAG
jgi:hypothetical protein